MRRIVGAVVLFGVGLLGLPVIGQEVGPGPGRIVKGSGEARADAGELFRGPGLVGKLRERGARVTALGERGGLSGWLVEPGRGDVYTLYVAEDGYAVAGLMYGPDGKMVTRAQLAQTDGGGKEVRDRRVAAAMSGRRSEVRGALESDRRGAAGDRFTVAHGSVAVEGIARRAPAGLFAKSAALFGFTLGHRGRTALVFADPGCRWSREAVDALGRQAMAGRFRLRVIPVGVLGGESARAAVRIASSPDPALAWFGRELAVEHRAGGMWIEQSNGVFDSWGENAVPLIAWRARSGRYVYAIGSISDVPAWVEEVFGP